jgi:hypothetical protein
MLRPIRCAIFEAGAQKLGSRANRAKISHFSKSVAYRSTKTKKSTSTSLVGGWSENPMPSAPALQTFLENSNFYCPNLQ